MRKITVVAFSICLICMIIAAFPRYSIADTIYGCYDQITGLLRIVASSDPANCTGCETLISWNSVGPAGTITIGSVTTGAPGTAAAVINTGTSSAAVLDFTIPQGATGTAATVTVGTTTTGAPGTPATVTTSGTSSAVTLYFTIPQGQTGATGPTGPQGPPGVANGISVAVHGQVNPTGTIGSGTGFTVAHTNPGVYIITFNTSFQTVPDCFVDLGATHAAYKCVAISSDVSMVEIDCVYTDLSTGYETYEDIAAFNFLCVN